MATYHLHPRRGPLKCTEPADTCSYGGSHKHYTKRDVAQQAFDELLFAEHDHLRAHGGLRETLEHNQLLRLDGALRYKAYPVIKRYAERGERETKSLDRLITLRSAAAGERAAHLRCISPEATTPHEEQVDKTTFRSLVQHYEAFRDKTALLVEAHTKSSYYKSFVEELPKDVKLGRVERTTSYEPNTREWLTKRFDTVGGSDVGTLVEADFTPVAERGPWTLSSVGRVEESKLVLPTDESMAKLRNFQAKKRGPLYRGTVWEERIRNIYAEAHPEYRVFSAEAQYLVPERPWQMVNLDGVIAEASSGVPKGILEIKTGGLSSKWEKGIPLSYRGQMLYYLNACGLEFAEVRALVNDSEVHEFRLYADDEVAPGSGLTMEEYIQKRVQPWFEAVKERRA